MLNHCTTVPKYVNKKSFLRGVRAALLTVAQRIRVRLPAGKFGWYLYECCTKQVDLLSTCKYRGILSTLLFLPLVALLQDFIIIMTASLGFCMFICGFFFPPLWLFIFEEDTAAIDWPDPSDITLVISISILIFCFIILLLSYILNDTDYRSETLIQRSQRIHREYM